MASLPRRTLSLFDVFMIVSFASFLVIVKLNSIFDFKNPNTTIATTRGARRSARARGTKPSSSSSATAVARVVRNATTARSESTRSTSNEYRKAKAGISCERYGGPSADSEALRRVVYWSEDEDDDTPRRRPRTSPFFDPDEEERYLTFEPDGGGWNNVRMAVETVVVLAHAMGRTLVLPPTQRLYLLGKTNKTPRNKQKVHFSFADFFHLDAEHLEREEGLRVITMEEFLKRTALRGRLVDRKTGVPRYPPRNNRTDWNGLALHEKELYEYLRTVTDVRNWKPRDCVAAFPADADPGSDDRLRRVLADAIADERDGGPPVPVDAPAADRLREILAGRTELCLYDETMQRSLVVHFMCYHKERARLLTHFYAFAFFEDWETDLRYKRLVRDRLRYVDELQCAAARVAEALRERARARNPNGAGRFDSLHVRRGDFQYKRTRVEASVIYENSRDVLHDGEEGSTVFVATDERDRTFFRRMAEHYDLCFLDDFRHLFRDLNTNYHGMLDQLVASQGHVFLGTYHSTFTGFVNRMRGYRATKLRSPGHLNGTIDSYYFVPLAQKYCMREYHALKKPFFNREFPIAWRDIDQGSS